MNRIGWTLFAVLVALLSAATPARAASCNGASHQVSLSNGTASPSTGTPSTPITFSVLYADSADCAPTVVTLNISGVGSFAPTATGTSFATGVTYSGTVTLAAGSYPYSFAATSGSGGGEKAVTLTSVSPGAVVIQSPTPVSTPVPTTVPAQAPTNRPTPRMVAPVAPAPSPAPTATPTPPAETSTVPSAASIGAETPDSASPIPLGSGPITNVHDSWVGAPAEGEPGTSGEARPADTGWRIPTTLVTSLVITAAGLAIFAFLVRRRGEGARQPVRAAVAPMPPEAAPMPPADTPMTPIGTQLLSAGGPSLITPLPPMRELIPPVDPDLLRDPFEPEGPLPEEAGIPRWLRPSVRASRREQPEFRGRNWG